MNLIDNDKIEYVKESTAANTSFSSSSSDSSSLIIGSIPVRIDFYHQPEQPQLDDYAVVTNIDRARIKKVYPKPSRAKSPVIGADLDII